MVFYGAINAFHHIVMLTVWFMYWCNYVVYKMLVLLILMWLLKYSLLSLEQSHSHSREWSHASHADKLASPLEICCSAKFCIIPLPTTVVFTDCTIKSLLQTIQTTPKNVHFPLLAEHSFLDVLLFSCHFAIHVMPMDRFTD